MEMKQSARLDFPQLRTKMYKFFRKVQFKVKKTINKIDSTKDNDFMFIFTTNLQKNLRSAKFYNKLFDKSVFFN